MLSRFSVLTRLREHENSAQYSKMRVYDGENLKDTDPKARSVQEYREAAGVDEGMNHSVISGGVRPAVLRVSRK